MFTSSVPAKKWNPQCRTLCLAHISLSVTLCVLLTNICRKIIWRLDMFYYLCIQAAAILENCGCLIEMVALWGFAVAVQKFNFKKGGRHSETNKRNQKMLCRRQRSLAMLSQVRDINLLTKSTTERSSVRLFYIKYKIQSFRSCSLILNTANIRCTGTSSVEVHAHRRGQVLLFVVQQVTWR